ncbi:DUF4177 domain-containing protein [Cognatilysobacter terrigena]|uniref:DUF4177 domain-containing protein n=1 Tax=Cognatilysobacter terrigena TaxID=2488749 RepID=UPI00105B8A0F|nr:DUF4177 domain-containing protein [Lysobacter terrigena]
MSGRWSYKVVELEIKLFGGSLTQRVQDELDRLGLEGWELVSAVQAAPVDSLRLILKKAV